jgi:hypothetical protein
MPGTLITLPVRMTIGWVRLVVRAAEDVTDRAVAVAGAVATAVMPDHSRGPDTPPFDASAAPTEASAAPTEAPAARTALPEDELASMDDESGAPSPEAAVADREPAHVSEEPELVREDADPGAEEGAGAEVNVTEPWDGYARMNASEIVARLRQATPAELAAVRLYESANRGRQTVLEAVDRQLKTSDGSGSPE